MGGFAHIIGQAATGALNPDFGKELAEHKFTHQENALRLWQLQHQQLADAIERNSAKYKGAEGERLRDLQIQVHALPPNTDLTPYHAAYAKHTALAQKQLEEAAAQGTRGGMGTAGITPIESPPNYLNSNPFAKMISQAPAPGGAALPTTSPVSPAAQGGAGSPDAAFPTDNAARFTRRFGTPGPEAPPSIPSDLAPVAEPGGNSGINAPVRSAAGPGVLVNSPLDFGPSASAFNSTGYIDPVIEAMLPGQVHLKEGQQLLDLIEPELRKMSGPNLNLPDLIKTEMRINALSGGKGSGSSLAGMAGLLRPVNVPGMIRADQLPPGTIDAFGNPIDPDTTPFVRVQKSLLGGPDQYYPEMGGTRATLELDPESKTGWARVTRDATGGEIKRVMSMAPPVGYIPQTSQSVKKVPGQADETTDTTRSRKIPGVNAPGSPTKPPANSLQSRPPTGPGGPGASTPSGSGGSLQPDGPPPGDHSYIAENYRKWIKGGKLTPKEETAVTQAAGARGWPTPDAFLSPSGQKDLAHIDPVLEEVKRMQALVDQRWDKLQKLGKLGLTSELILYKRGIDTPNSDLISGLSFADLRSAAQALQGSGSRAMPILNRALEHTPHIGYTDFSTPSQIKTLLKEMRTRLEEGRTSIFSDEGHGGVIMNKGGGAPGTIPSIRPGAAADPLGIR